MSLNNEVSARLNTRLEKAVAAARVRVFLGFALAAASVAGIQYWLGEAHDRFAEVTPEFVSDYATAKVMDSIPNAAPEIKTKLVSYAPKVLDEAESRLLNLPDQFATEVTTRLTHEAGKVSEATEEELYKTLRAGIADASEKVGGSGDDAARLKAFADEFGKLYYAESAKLLDKASSHYRQNAGSALGYLEFLGNDQNLNAREKLQREALATFLTVAHRKTAGAAPSGN